MSKAISEQALETVIVADLTKAHYSQRPPSAFDKALCLDPGPLIDFVQATQPKEWKKFVEQHRESARDQFLKRVAEAIEQVDAVLDGWEIHRLMASSAWRRAQPEPGSAREYQRAELRCSSAPASPPGNPEPGRPGCCEECKEQACKSGDEPGVGRINENAHPDKRRGERHPDRANQLSPGVAFCHGNRTS
jgi:hypothetical protein